MAPSSRRAAPSTSTPLHTPTPAPSRTVSKSKQIPAARRLASGSNSKTLDFGRVTKAPSTRLGSRVKLSDSKKEAVEKWCDHENEEDGVGNEDGSEKENEDVAPLNVPRVRVAPKSPKSQLGAKRKRGEVSDCESESEREVKPRNGGVDVLRLQEQSKKRRVQSRGHLLSPPLSREGTDCDEHSVRRSKLIQSPRTRHANTSLQPTVDLPLALTDLISMHGAFLKALSLHYAHNGASSPAEMTNLMGSMTRIWKKQNVRTEAIQRMLGLYEVASDPKTLALKQVEQRCGPFKIVTSGFGSNVRSNLEYVGQVLYSENTLQAAYSKLVHTSFRVSPDIENTTSLPLLTITLGTQTSLYREKASGTRAEILGLSAAAQSRSSLDFSKLSITEPSDHTPAAVKSRTLSLFDRVRAKGLAAINNAAPTSEQITRRHAIGRIGEIVEFLRMKQQQKMSTQFYSSIHDSPSKLRGGGKVSFSLGAIVNDIRQSVGVPIGETEVKTCLTILSQEVPGDWCRMIALGSIVSITLQGAGMSGIEVQKLLEK